VHFTKLRLSGFKSFVDPTELIIEPGLTAIVGPNGCGKSNLVEALRWVMGETSAKQMRGGAMDDVIFNGTQSRSSRNLAEVVLSIDNDDRMAPAAINDADELEVSRKIERDSGSTYRINGREVRARDVQLLFADAATGAHSPALVSQGRVSAVIAAKPTDRRALLEEAAGITGLHSRRHEAELRLRGADNNLERLDDVMATLESQLQAMKRQARQANRYRRVAEQIRRAEAIQLHRRYQEASRSAAQLEQELAEAERLVGAAAARVAEAETMRLAAAEALPPLRQAEASAAAGLHRLVVAEDGLEADERRVVEEARGLEARILQLADDARREDAIRRDAEAALARLSEEREALSAAQAGEAAALAEVGAEIERQSRELIDRENALQELTDATAREAARRDGLASRHAEAEARAARLDHRRLAARVEHAELEATLGREAEVAGCRRALAEAEAAAEAASEALEAAEAARRDAEAALAEARDALQTEETALAELVAEESALSAVLEVDKSGLWSPLVDAVTVTPGYETALGAALGDDLNVPADEGAPVHWRTLDADPAAPALPAGVAALADAVKAPAALRRRLSQVGVVAAEDGPLLQLQLRQGQRLVSTEGALWRWDGFTVGAGAETQAAARLAQRNRLAELRGNRPAAVAKRDRARQRFEAERGTAGAADAALTRARETARETARRREEVRRAHGEAERRAADKLSRLAALDELQRNLAAEIAEAAAARDSLAAELAALEPLDGARRRLDGMRQEVARRRTRLIEARGGEAMLRREADARAERLRATGTETDSWRKRFEGAGAQLEVIATRRRDGEAALAAAQAKPAEIATRRELLQREIAGAREARNAAAEALAGQEAELEARQKALRTAEQESSDVRERRARLEAALEAARERVGDATRRIRESLDCLPAEALAAGGVEAGEELPSLGDTEERLERLLRERERMGPVNLRAEQEAEELSQQLAGMTAERADLVAAIQRLRQGIASLNREGRERLLAAFRQVDTHFQDLFVRLFGGGKAHLALTESDDPLEAGLEIMASPPGKRLQIMSLLSGGEQALTALSLLFAVFLTNPAPICVLDEVDAPLDDANVERFCNLVQEISRITGTRFLVITHHSYTMARVDRLYGVTMAERGVSQLVSVDLSRAERLRMSA
jgi:chromosome segregation protein